MKVLSKLRCQLLKYGIQGYIIPSVDEYQSEYTPNFARRLEYVTNFSGSNGLAVIGQNKSLFFTDGRYLTQAKNELNLLYFQILDIKDLLKIQWEEYFDLNTTIFGYDPNLFTKKTISYFNRLRIKEITPNLVDLIWSNQPSPPISKAYIYPLEYAGLAMEDKIIKIRNIMKSEYHTDYYLITNISSICWLLNIRASDIEFSPLMLSYCLIGRDKVYLFTSLERFTPKMINYLKSYLSLYEADQLKIILNQLEGKIILTEQCPISLLNSLKLQVISLEIDPCKLIRACKNSVEIVGAKNAHIKDAVAVCEFFAWLEFSLSSNVKLTEIDLSNKITEFRSIQEGYISNSFSNICGFKENSAIIHYHPNRDHNKKIIGDGILLIDSGAHYFGGTTDITRTIVIGRPTEMQKRRYTQILKGHIALSSTVFSENIYSGSLDILARQYLWQDGVDYPHGTGHGVGNALSVHEYPPSIKPNSNTKLKSGMIVSNEPGYYDPNNYGIRIENLLYVKASKYIGFLEFENLTLVPYCHNLIINEYLTDQEWQYISSYYKQIIKTIKPLLSKNARFWIDRFEQYI